jgi:hypothetical protein
MSLSAVICPSYGEQHYGVIDEDMADIARPRQSLSS